MRLFMLSMPGLTVFAAPECVERGQRALDAILVKSVAPVRAAIVGATLAVDFVAAPLRRHRRHGVHGMVVDEAVDHGTRIDIGAAIQGQQNCTGARSDCRMFKLYVTVTRSLPATGK